MIILLFIFGLVIGSFLGMLTYRLPREINFVSDRSRCDNCNEIINWYDNIPLISFIILKGRCRHCHTHISFREPLIELATAITFAFIGLNIFYLIIASILIAIFIIDLEHQIIPDELIFLGILVFIIYSLQSSFFSPLLAGLLAADFLLFLNLVTKGRGMGLGDVKLAILLGALANFKLVLPWMFFSFLTGAIVGIILIIYKKANLKAKIAFGPFLIIGLVLAFKFGHEIFF